MSVCIYYTAGSRGGGVKRVGGGMWDVRGEKDGVGV